MQYTVYTYTIYSVHINNKLCTHIQYTMYTYAILLSDRNKILNDEQRRQRNSPQIKIDNAEKSLFPKKMKCIMINNYYKGLRIL